MVDACAVQLRSCGTCTQTHESELTVNDGTVISDSQVETVVSCQSETPCQPTLRIQNVRCRPVKPILSSDTDSSLESLEDETPVTVCESHARMLGGGSLERVGNSMSSVDFLFFQLSATLRREVRDLVTFDGCEHILRGTSLAVVLKSCGSILANSKGSEHTYSLSEVVRILDAFISHNWSVPRYQKIIALNLHFNFNIASGIALSLSVVTACVEYFTNRAPADRDGHFFRLLFLPIFVVVLFFVRDVSFHAGVKGPAVFLDKTCIHQVDEGLQKEGIRKLGAFLHKSESMVVLYTDVYLHKLWTIYEVASFLAMRPVNRMQIVSVYQSMLSCTFGAMIEITAIIRFVSASLRPEMGMLYLVYFLEGLVGLVSLFLLRWWYRHCSEVLINLSSFSVHECKCHCESDRPLVYHNIACLMRATGRAVENSSLEEALECFNSLVRSELPNAFKVAMGGTMFGLRHIAFGACSLFGMSYFDALPSIPTWKEALIKACGAFWKCCIIAPLIIRTMERLASSCMHLTKTFWMEAAWMVFGFFAGVGCPVILLFFWVLEPFTEIAATSDLALIALVLSCILGAVLVGVFLQDHRWFCKHTRGVFKQSSEWSADWQPGTSRTWCHPAARRAVVFGNSTLEVQMTTVHM
eukprot:TRINITY_DN40960_c0_g1_i1.p1 TRINITY_DN40960_c0_g1~~TRINITY_DN40960_c0_g1_i1.p1  ORF type:complete len:640 (-),score=89.15 TRINITY_DN40960_c0_g1_i1:79-1998(-)